MGVSGCGKSTVAEHLARLLGASFKDGDELHPPANIAKMERGEPLDDADRMPWLAAVRDHSATRAREHGLHVVACSALARRYRDVLDGAGDVTYVFLEGDVRADRVAHARQEGPLHARDAAAEPVRRARIARRGGRTP